MELPIYLDNHATTPVDPEVVAAMLPFFTTKFGNVSSHHAFGQAVRKDCDQARLTVAQLIGADAHEIIFTSGATESNNLAIKGFADARASDGRHIISCVTEHKSVLDTCAFLKGQGFEITYLPVDSMGMVRMSDLESAIRNGKGTDRTIMVSLMAGNNEIGTLHPLASISKICKEHNLAFHVDGAQAVGKIPVNVRELGIDFLSISGHKIYGPKGVGALYVRGGCKNEQLCAQMHGGGQECGYRSGTLPVPLVIGLAKACEIASAHGEAERTRLKSLAKRLWTGISSKIESCTLNGHPEERLPGNVHITLRGIDSELLQLGLKDLAVSSTSACSAQAHKPSHVLKALGLCDADAMTSLRFGIGRFNTTEEIDAAIEMVVAAYNKYRDRRSTGRAVAMSREVLN